MPERKVAPYGSWKSPITAELVASKAIWLEQIVLDGEAIFWIERRPTEGGRCVIVQCTPDGKTQDLTPVPLNARTRVHEYGGGAYAVADGVAYFSNLRDQRLWSKEPGNEPRPITPEGDCRYADGVVDRERGHLLCVREDHTGRPPTDPNNTLVRVDLGGKGSVEVLLEGNDFYASPRLSPDGTRLAWLTWNHPNMPWDGTELWMAELARDGALRAPQCIAGGAEESIFQPQWSPDGLLYFVSDRSGWWNLYRERDERIEPLRPMEAEFGRPQWVFGMATYAFASDSQIICAYAKGGIWHLGELDTRSGTLRKIETPYTEIDSVRAQAGRAVFLAGSPGQALAVVLLELQTGTLAPLRSSSTVEIDPKVLSIPETIAFPTEDGKTAYAFFYPPKNDDFTAPEDEAPLLLVKSHGGPTGSTSNLLDLGVQYWTSRGFALVDVNYGGSTGYGRAYRERLRSRWGIVDVDDCIHAARFLAERGRVDGERLAIRGGSAGGYTTLCALTFRDVFRAGASYYGVGDPEALARETHKFESRYLDRLIAPHPKGAEEYRARSPLHHAGGLSCPVIFFQGLEDRVVPLNQAESMVEALRRKGVPVAYLPFPEEQHGFRRAENIQRALEAELYFYSRIFGFALAETIHPVPIENLGSPRI